MYGIARIFGHADFRLWLQGDLQPPEIDFRSYPESRHSRWGLHEQKQQMAQIEIRMSISRRTSRASTVILT